MPEQPPVTLISLISAAEQEDWDFIDTTLASVADNPNNVLWAFGNGVFSEDGNVRDLAVSIVEASQHFLEPDQAEVLQNLMQSDKNTYVRFRAAFALYNRGERSPEVMQVMQEALQVDDVKEITQGYLDQLK